MDVTAPTVIREDNMSAIHVAQNTSRGAARKNSRHIVMRHHSVREAIRKELIVFKHIKGTENPADLLTKPLVPAKFLLHVDHFVRPVKGVHSV